MSKKTFHRTAGLAVVVIMILTTFVPSALVQGQEGLMGALEGPEVITDPALYPTSFSEAPMLAEKVEAGELPPLEERLPVADDVLVLRPVHETGNYGGVIRRGFTGPGDLWNGKRFAAHDHILYFDYQVNKVVPNVAKGWEVTDEGRTITIFLREGMKWSDGAPLTADDFLFWYEDVYQNEELVTSPSSFLSINGQPGTVEKVDDYTVRYSFPDPYPLFPEVLAGFANISSHANWGNTNMGGLVPAHYLKQFHPNYVAEEELTAMVEEGGYDNWVALFTFKNSWGLNPDLPALTPWVTTRPANSDVWVMERNPYFYVVDTEGNQLPYIDRVEFTLAEDLEVLNLRAVAGEYDFQARHIDIQKLPVFLENMEQGGYNVYLDPGDNGANAHIYFNLSYTADPELEKWFNTPDFRRALSLGIERDQINEIFFLGLGMSSSPLPASHNQYFPGEEYRTLWHTYDPETANAMLDELGLDAKDSEGFRLRSDGEGRLTLTLTTVAGSFVPYTQVAEVLKEQLKEIGIDITIKEVERSLWQSQSDANEIQISLWDNGGTERLFGEPSNLLRFLGPDYWLWLNSGGEEGREPPARVVEALHLWQSGFGASDEERVEIGKHFWTIYAEEVWSIGIVGFAPATMGVRLANQDLGNVPTRQVFSLDGMTPGISRPETFYWK